VKRQRAYELMIIHDGELDDATVQEEIKSARAALEGAGGTVANVDYWGRRRFGYPINHKNEGYYSVYEVLAEGGQLDPVERSLRIADSVVRHKLIRLPDAEAERRGLLGAAAETE
jgi:small subunit ribosomal protein S6